MKLWHLWRTGKIGYDETEGFVIRAETAERAREIAYDKADYEYTQEEWKTAPCMELKYEGPEDMILRDFNAG